MEYSDLEAYEVGKRQRIILWLIIASLVGLAVRYVGLLIGLISAFYVYQLAKAEKSSFAWLWGVSQFIPLVGLICLFIVNQRATAILRDKNIRVGLMGADAEQLERLRTTSGPIEGAVPR